MLQVGWPPFEQCRTVYLRWRTFHHINRCLSLPAKNLCMHVHATRRHYLETDPDPIAMVIRVDLFTHKPSETNTNWHGMVTHARVCYRWLLSNRACGWIARLYNYHGNWVWAGFEIIPPELKKLWSKRRERRRRRLMKMPSHIKTSSLANQGLYPQQLRKLSNLQLATMYPQLGCNGICPIPLSIYRKKNTGKYRFLYSQQIAHWGYSRWTGITKTNSRYYRK